MGHETNIDSIQALDKQIEEGKGDIIKLKRVRNSFLNISTRVPPEILGHIFVRCLIWKAGRPLGPWDVDQLQEGSLQLPPRLSPLVRGRISHSGTLEFLGKHFARLEETSPPLRSYPP